MFDQIQGITLSGDSQCKSCLARFVLSRIDNVMQPNHTLGFKKVKVFQMQLHHTLGIKKVKVLNIIVIILTITDKLLDRAGEGFVFAGFDNLQMAESTKQEKTSIFE